LVGGLLFLASVGNLSQFFPVESAWYRLQQL